MLGVDVLYDTRYHTYIYISTATPPARPIWDSDLADGCQPRLTRVIDKPTISHSSLTQAYVPSYAWTDHRFLLHDLAVVCLGLELLYSNVSKRISTRCVRRR